MCTFEAFLPPFLLSFISSELHILPWRETVHYAVPVQSYHSIPALNIADHSDPNTALGRCLTGQRAALKKRNKHKRNTLEKNPRVCDSVSSVYKCRLVWIYTLAKPAATHRSGERMCSKGIQKKVHCFPLAALCSHITVENVILWSTEQ